MVVKIAQYLTPDDVLVLWRVARTVGNLDQLKACSEPEGPNLNDIIRENHWQLIPHHFYGRPIRNGFGEN